MTAPGTRGGTFITFEGGEGAGKSTQIRRLATSLRARSGRPVVTTREPGGSLRAEAIREALLSGVAKPYGPFAEALLFSAARIDHLDTLIRPALGRGERDNRPRPRELHGPLPRYADTSSISAYVSLVKNIRTQSRRRRHAAAATPRSS